MFCHSKPCALETPGAHSPHIALCPSSVQVRTSPYKSVFPCPHPVHCAMCFASRWECALFSGERTAHGARGETSLFPPVPPFRPACCMEACGTQCGSLSYRARTVSRPGGKRYGLNARCHSAAPNILGAVAAPLCSDSLPRPLRARHRRASPRVLENAQGSSATASHVFWKLRGTRHTLHHVPIVRQVRQVRQVRHSLPAVSALHYWRLESEATADHMPAGATRRAAQE